MEPSDPTANEQRAKRRGKRIIAASFVTLASVFIGMSALQIVPQVFGIAIQPLASAQAGPTSGACGDGVRALTKALDRAMAEAQGGRTTDEEAAMASFRASLSPEWDREPELDQRCAAEPHGRDAFAALLRLRLADEHFVRRQVVEIAPLRSDVAAYLPK